MLNLSNISKILKQKKAVFIVLASIVVSITTYSLILPAFTLEKEEAEKQGGIDTEVEQVSDDTDIDVQELDSESSEYADYQDRAEAAVQKILKKENAHSKIAASSVYDISLLKNGEETEPETEVSVDIQFDKDKRVSGADNVRIVHFAVNDGKEKIEVLDQDDVTVTQKKGKITEVSFDTDSFSIFAVVYTVDFEYGEHGNKYRFSIDGGDSITVTQLAKKLGILKGSKTDEKAFTEGIKDVRFSDEDLVYVTRLDENKAVYEVLNENDLHVIYPLGLKMEEVLAINHKEYKAGDWLLISLKPFTSKETLTITMDNGEEFTINVTDAQDATMNDDGTVQTVPNPAGTTIDLFDYWIVSPELAGREGWGDLNTNWGAHDDTEGDNGYNLNGSGNNKGINSSSEDAEHGHALKFSPGWDGTVYNGSKVGTHRYYPNWDSGDHDTYYDEQESWRSLNAKGKDGLNSYTGDGDPFQGIVQGTLVNGYPALTTNDTIGTTGESLAYLFNPNTEHAGKASYPGVNQLMYVDKEGYYTYDSREYSATFDESANKFKLSEQESDNSEIRGFWPFGTQNFWMGMHVNTQFSMPTDGKVLNPAGDYKDMQFEFSGDDDVWVYVDGLLIGDAGGIHNRTEIDINFAEGVVKVTGKKDPVHGGEFVETKYLDDIYKAAGRYEADDWEDIPGSTHQRFKAGTYHTFDFFYLERGGGESNLYIHYNLVSTADFTAHKAYKGQDENDLLKRDQFKFELIGLDGKFRSVQRDGVYVLEQEDTTTPAIMPHAASGGAGTVADPFYDGDTTTVLHHGTVDQDTVHSQTYRTGVTEDGNVNFGSALISEQDMNDADQGNPPVYRYIVREIVPDDAVNEDGIAWQNATPEQKAQGGFVKDNIEYDGREYYMTARVTSWTETDATGQEVVRHGLSKTYYTDDTYTTVKDNTSFIDFQNRYMPDYGNVSFQKVDGNRVALAGAKFALFTDPECTKPFKNMDAEGKPQWEAVSGSDGLVSFEHVRTGTYYMKETEAPEGFDLDETVYKVVIADSRDTTNKSKITVNGDESGKEVTQIINIKPGEISVVKHWQDKDGKETTDVNQEARIRLKRRIVSKDSEKITVNIRSDWQEGGNSINVTKEVTVNKNSAIITWDDNGQFGRGSNRIPSENIQVSPSSVTVTDDTVHGNGNQPRFIVSNLKSTHDNVSITFTYTGGRIGDSDWFVNYVNERARSLSITPTGDEDLIGDIVEDTTFNTDNNNVTTLAGSPWSYKKTVGGTDSTYSTGDTTYDYPARTDDGKTYRYYIAELDEDGNELPVNQATGLDYTLISYSNNNTEGITSKGVLEVTNKLDGPFELKIEKEWSGIAPDDPALTDSSINVMIRRYVLKDNAGTLVINKTGVPETADLSAKYTVKNGSGETVAEYNYVPGGNIARIPLIPGDYTVTETIVSDDERYTSSHPEAGTEHSQNITVSFEQTSTVTFTSTYEEKKGSLIIQSSYTDGGSGVDFSGVTYTVYDSNGQQVGNPYSYSAASQSDGVTINDLLVGTYTVVESAVPSVTGYTVTRTPEAAQGSTSSITVNVTEGTGGDARTVEFNTVYAVREDSGSKYSIHRPNGWGGNVIESGDIDYPAGTQIIFSFCSTGNWDRIENVNIPVTYNGEELENQFLDNNTYKSYMIERLKYQGTQYAKYSIPITVVNNALLDITVNAELNKDQIYDIQITEADNGVNTLSAAPLREGINLMANANVSNTATDPTPADYPSKTYVLDEGFSREVPLSYGNWEETLTDLPAKDNNGNPYYYFIDSAVETNLPEGTVPTIVMDNGEKRLVSRDNSDNTSLQVINTVPQTDHPDLTVKKVDADKAAIQAEDRFIGGAVFSLYKVGETEELIAEPDIVNAGTGTAIALDSNHRFTIPVEGITINDLQNGSYKLVEYSAPTGYVIVEDTTTFTVLNGKVYNSNNVEISSGVALEIENPSGAELPSAGGPGTHWMYLIGAVLAIGCAIALIAKKRCEN